MGPNAIVQFISLSQQSWWARISGARFVWSCLAQLGWGRGSVFLRIFSGGGCFYAAVRRGPTDWVRGGGKFEQLRPIPQVAGASTNLPQGWLGGPSLVGVDGAPVDFMGGLAWVVQPGFIRTHRGRGWRRQDGRWGPEGRAGDPQRQRYQTTLIQRGQALVGGWQGRWRVFLPTTGLGGGLAALFARGHSIATPVNALDRAFFFPEKLRTALYQRQNLQPKPHWRGGQAARWRLLRELKIREARGGWRIATAGLTPARFGQPYRIRGARLGRSVQQQFYPHHGLMPTSVGVNQGSANLGLSAGGLVPHGGWKRGLSDRVEPDAGGLTAAAHARWARLERLAQRPRISYAGQRLPPLPASAPHPLRRIARMATWLNFQAQPPVPGTHKRHRRWSLYSLPWQRSRGLAVRWQQEAEVEGLSGRHGQLPGVCWHATPHTLRAYFLRSPSSQQVSSTPGWRACWRLRRQLARQPALQQLRAGGQTRGFNSSNTRTPAGRGQVNSHHLDGQPQLARRLPRGRRTPPRIRLARVSRLRVRPQLASKFSLTLGPDIQQHPQQLQLADTVPTTPTTQVGVDWRRGHLVAAMTPRGLQQPQGLGRGLGHQMPDSRQHRQWQPPRVWRGGQQAEPWDQSQELGGARRWFKGRLATLSPTTPGYRRHLCAQRVWQHWHRWYRTWRGAYVKDAPRPQAWGSQLRGVAWPRSCLPLSGRPAHLTGGGSTEHQLQTLVQRAGWRRVGGNEVGSRSSATTRQLLSSFVPTYSQPQVRYTPGLTRYWRHHRQLFQRLFWCPWQRPQWRLTRYIARLRFLTGFSVLKAQFLTTVQLTWQSGLFAGLTYRQLWAVVCGGGVRRGGLISCNPLSPVYQGEVLHFNQGEMAVWWVGRRLPTIGGTPGWGWRWGVGVLDGAAPFAILEVDELALAVVLLSEAGTLVPQRHAWSVRTPFSTLKLYNWKYTT